MKTILLIGLFFSFIFFTISFSTAAIPLSPTNFSRTKEIQTETFGTTKTIQQYGITWTFSQALTYGQFINGDYWVIDPGTGVKITNISPGVVVSGGRTMNGSMLNPYNTLQGFDSTREYDAALNVGIGVSAGTPLVITGSNSLVSSISVATIPTSTSSYVKTAAILTVLSTAPPTNSFRPAYSWLTKNLYNESQINYDKLLTLPIPASTPNLATYEKYFQRTWLMHSKSWTSRFMHPADNIPDNYYYVTPLSEAAMLLHLDYTNAQKRTLLIELLQHGIDLYGTVKRRGNGWDSAAGVGWGRKYPIMFAGLILGESGMTDIAAKSADYLYTPPYGPGNRPPAYLNFAEDSCFFFVQQRDIERTASSAWCPDDRSGTAYPYTNAMLGMPEWGHRYAEKPCQIDSAWYAIYRTVNNVNAHIGMTLSIMLMGEQDLWNGDALFSYTDRYMAISQGKPDPFGYQVIGQKAVGGPTSFLATMWDAYRAKH